MSVPIEISLKLRGFKTLISDLEKSSRLLRRGFRPAFKKAKERIGDEVDKLFEDEGQTADFPWKEMATLTELMRANRKGYYAQPPQAPDKLGQWLGQMKRAWQLPRRPVKGTITSHAFEYGIFDENVGIKYWAFVKGRPSRGDDEGQPPRKIIENIPIKEIMEEELLAYLQRRAAIWRKAKKDD